MRNWTGNKNDRIGIGDGITMLRNVSLITSGQLGRRPQLGTRFTLSADLLTSLHPRGGGDFLIAADGSGKIVSVNTSDSTSADLATGLSADIRGCFVSHQQNIYYTNDFDAVQRINTGTGTAVSAGIAAATAAPAFSSNSTGSLTTGTYRSRFRYKDTRTGYVSNPGPEYSQTFTAASQSMRVTGIASTDAKVNQIVWERTSAGGSEFWIEGTGANSTAVFEFEVSDATLTSGISADSYYGAFGHEAPPTTELLTEHRGRLFGYKSSVRTRTAVSIALSAASVTGTNFSQKWVGRLATFSGTSAVSYVVASVSASGTSLTLSSNFSGSTSTAASMSIFSPTPDMLYWSRAGFPESWKPSVWARRVLNNGDRATALFSAYDTLWVCGLRTIKTFDYTSDPASARISTIPTQMGVYNQRCVVNCEGRMICMGPAGIFELQGRVPTSISAAIDQDIANIIDNTQYESFHGAYDFYEDTVTFWFCRSGDTVPKDAVAYHLPSGEWQMRSWRQGISCSATIGTDSLSPRPYLGCENGYTWRLTDSLVGDGIPSALTTGVVTVDAGATTTSIPVVEALPTGTGDCKGVMLYNPLTGTAKAITSNTATTFTCAAFSAAPAQGTELYLGSIDVFLKSEWWAGPSPHALKRPSYLMLEHLSDDTAPEVDIQIYKSLSSTAMAFTKGLGDSHLSGVTYTNAATSANVDLSHRAGVLYLNTVNEFSPYWRWELTQEVPYGILKLMDVKWLIRNKEEIDAKVKPT